MAEELPVDLRTRRPQNPPGTPQNSTPETSLPLRKRRSAVRGFGGGEGSGDTPPSPQNLGKNPKLERDPHPDLGSGSSVLGGGAILGVPPPPPPSILGVPPPLPPPLPPLAAAVAAATRQDEDGDTPLHIAVAQGALPVARRLVALFLRGGRDLDVYNHLRQTPLHLAVITGQVALVRLLVAPMSPGVSRCFQVCLTCLRCLSPVSGVSHLSQVSLTCLRCVSPVPQTPLHLAVITGQVALVRLLVAHGASPMAPDRLGRTCAHLACGSHLEGGGASAGPRPRVLRELLRLRPDLQARDYEGLTPLHVAVTSGCRDSVELLLEHGADIDAADIKSGRSPLLHAVENNSLEMAELLLQRGASVNAQSYAGCTALHAAAARGRLRLLRLLLRCGADCGLRKLQNDTAAGVAASAQVIDILRGKSSRPPQDPPKGSAAATSGFSANGERGAGPRPQSGAVNQSGADQSEAAARRPRPGGGRGQSGINGK